MNTDDRRKEIINVLKASDKPISASALAKRFSISRQVIVSDIAILRAQDHNIESGNRGYTLKERKSFPYIGIISAKHGIDRLRDELNTIVDFGGTCIDVSITHSFYGEIKANLYISSRYEVERFIKNIASGDTILSEVSGGLHCHKIGCDSLEIFNLIKDELDKLGIIF